MLKNIITHPGTGTETIREIITSFDYRVRLHVVTDLNHARRVKFDGVILLGGSDISPHFYGERLTYAYPGSRKRDAVEWYLTRTALNREIPIMGICRGHQMLAVAHGVGLYQDMAECAVGWHPSAHRLTAINRPLKRYIPTHKVNSLHHQAIRKTPSGFKTLAMDHKGKIVEAIYSPGYLGVQWHPELLYPSDTRWRDLFGWFVKDSLS